MADYTPLDTEKFKQKSFWQKPEGVTGTIFLLGLLAGGGYLLYIALPTLIGLMSNLL